MRNPIEPVSIRRVKIIEVIETVYTRGNGVDDVHREVTQYWSKEGKLLGENDPCVNQDMKKLDNVTIVQLAKQLENGIINARNLHEDMSVSEFLRHYLNN